MSRSCRLLLLEEKLLSHSHSKVCWQSFRSVHMCMQIYKFDFKVTVYPFWKKCSILHYRLLSRTWQGCKSNLLPPTLTKSSIPCSSKQQTYYLLLCCFLLVLVGHALEQWRVSTSIHRRFFAWILVVVYFCDYSRVKQLFFSIFISFLIFHGINDLTRVAHILGILTLCSISVTWLRWFSFFIG